MGRPALALADLHLRGTYRKDRHQQLIDPKPAEQKNVSRADRKRVLDGLNADGRRIVADLLDRFGDWTASSLITLRLYAESCQRLLTPLEDDERRRETRLNLQLLSALELEK